MLRLQAVSKSYGAGGSSVVALHPTTLEVARGDYVAVVGPSGSGKSTLLSIVGGMLAPSGGRVFLDGQSVYDMPVTTRAAWRRQKIGFVFQTFNLVPYLTALENVQVPLYLAGVPGKEQRRRGRMLLERVGLAGRAGHKPGELSVGQQQRVALARMLANDPVLILADEPTGNLDSDTRQQVQDLFDGFHRDGRTILLVTHDPVVADRARSSLRLLDGRACPHVAAPRSMGAA
jgi:putative ABC transport system ATP-binding protein